MPQHPSDLDVFLAVLCLPAIVRLLMLRRVWGPVRAAFAPVVTRARDRWSRGQEPDETVLGLMAVARLEQLQRHLDRVQKLVGHDDHMPATRQTGNRLALERLRSDVRDAGAAVSALGLTPSPAAPALRWGRIPATPAQPYVEVLELGPVRVRRPSTRGT